MRSGLPSRLTSPMTKLCPPPASFSGDPGAGAKSISAAATLKMPTKTVRSAAKVFMVQYSPCGAGELSNHCKTFVKELSATAGAYEMAFRVVVLPWQRLKTIDVPEKYLPAYLLEEMQRSVGASLRAG